jgi:hypothetical protein
MYECSLMLNFCIYIHASKEILNSYYVKREKIMY